MIDIIPRLIAELRDDAGVEAIVEDRVRGYEPRQPLVKDGITQYEGDARGPGQYIAFVVLVLLTAPRYPTIPVQQPRVLARCYGRTVKEASDLYGAVSDALHFRGPRVTNSMGIYQSHDETGGNPDIDPDTAQPYYAGVFAIQATTQAVS